VFHRDDLPIAIAEQPTQGDGLGRPPKTPFTRYMEPALRSPEPGKKASSLRGDSSRERGPNRTTFMSGSRRWILPALLFVVLLVCQAIASGATTVTAHSPARYSVTHVGAPPTAPATLTAMADRVATAAYADLPAAGTQLAGTPGLAGTPTALPECLAAPCRDRYIVASPAGLVVGDYAERGTFALTQPVAPPGVSTGFLVEIAVHLSTGWIFGRAYLATGTTTLAGGAAITLQLYVNLGTAAAPTILGVDTVVDTCTSATVCP
jgi:hypothetical protein